MRLTRPLAIACSVIVAGLLAAPADAATSMATATTAKAAGGMTALVKAAKAEKTVRVVGLAPSWANYGAVMKAFTKKYGVTVTSVSPDASSNEALTLVRSLKGKATQPDVVELGLVSAVQAQREGLLAPYQVTAYKDIPAGLRAADASWYASFCSAMAIGYDSARIAAPPTALGALASAGTRVALIGTPTTSASAFSAVYAGALANGGTLYTASKGVRLFAAVQRSGLLYPLAATAATVKSGETPLVLDWEHGQRALASVTGVSTWKYTVPTDASYAACYSQAITRTAPHPAAARLWQEFLYSNEGQNLLLNGGVRPARLNAMTKAGTVDAAAAAKLPALTKPLTVANVDQVLAAQDSVTTLWPLLAQL